MRGSLEVEARLRDVLSDFRFITGNSVESITKTYNFGPFRIRYYALLNKGIFERIIHFGHELVLQYDFKVELLQHVFVSEMGDD